MSEIEHSVRLSSTWLRQLVQLVLPRVIIQLILLWFAESQKKQIKANNLWLRRSFILSENQRSEWVEFVGSLFREVFPRVLRFSALTKNEHYRISAD